MVPSDPLRVLLLCPRWWPQNQGVQALLHLSVWDAEPASQMHGVGGRNINLMAKCALPKSLIPASVSFWEESGLLLQYLFRPQFCN